MWGLNIRIGSRLGPFSAGLEFGNLGVTQMVTHVAGVLNFGLGVEEPFSFTSCD